MECCTAPDDADPSDDLASDDSSPLIPDPVIKPEDASVFDRLPCANELRAPVDTLVEALPGLELVKVDV